MKRPWIAFPSIEWMWCLERTASCDTHPKDGDVKQAPLVSGAVPSETSADAQPQSHTPSESNQ